MRLLKEYYLYFFDGRIQRQYDMGQIVMAHNLLHNLKINHYILTPHIDDFLMLIKKENLLDISWSDLSMKYPDDLKTLHTSYEGHIEVYKKILNKINE